MGNVRRFQPALNTRFSNCSAVAIKHTDSEVFVETQSAGQFFLKGFGNTIGHGGIKRRSVLVQPFRVKRFADATLHPKSSAPLRSCSFSEAQGRGHRGKKESQYWYPDRTPRLRRCYRWPRSSRRSSRKASSVRSPRRGPSPPP